MKTKWMHLIAGVTVVVLCISVCTTTVNANGSWQDDFETGLDGWTFFGYEDDGTGNYSVLVEGNFSAEGGVMTVLDDGVNVARHNSTTSVGTWLFDIYIPVDDFGAIDIVFMSDGGRCGFDDPGNEGSVWSGNWITFEAWDDYFALAKAVEGDFQALKWWHDSETSGWQHFNISRTSNGYVYVYLNGTQKAATPHTDDVTSSIYLEVWMWNAANYAFDNLVVIDKSLPDSTPPPDSPLWILITVGGGVAIAVIVLAIVFLRRR